MLWGTLFSSRPDIKGASGEVRRCCYLPLDLLDAFIKEPGVVEQLASELGAEQPASSSTQARLLAIRRRAVHLSVSASSYFGLSVEEIIILTALRSPSFEHTSLARELHREVYHEELALQCASWLERDGHEVFRNVDVGRVRWDLVGRSASATLLGDPMLATVTLVPDVPSMGRLLTHRSSEVAFAHGAYVACTPATALRYLFERRSQSSEACWDVTALDRQLRSIGMGLLLADPAGVSASHHPPFNPCPPGLPVLRERLERARPE